MMMTKICLSTKNRLIQKNHKDQFHLNVQYGSVNERRCAPGMDDYVARVAVTASVVRAAEDAGHVILGGGCDTDATRASTPVHLKALHGTK